MIDVLAVRGGVRWLNFSCAKGFVVIAIDVKSTNRVDA
jgi:hypothetical protein